ncbi:MAG: M48 family metallopeptidase [Pseudomonadota bacterium]
MYDGTLYDGKTADGKEVQFQISPENVILFDDLGRRLEQISIDRIERVSRTPRLVLGHRDRFGWRLIVNGDLKADDDSRIIKKSSWARLQKRYGLVPLLAGCAGLFALVVSVALNFSAVVVPLIPDGVARAIGDQFQSAFVSSKDVCTEEQGNQALQRLTDKLTPQDGLRFAPNVVVADMGIVNAFALPAGHVVISKQLIDAADSPDEVAGVLAHEIGHTRYRHSMHALVDALGVFALLGALGGDFGGLSELAVVLRRSRAAEREADAFALESLDAANISPEGFAAFFRRIDLENFSLLQESGENPDDKGGVETDDDEAGQPSESEAANADEDKQIQSDDGPSGETEEDDRRRFQTWFERFESFASTHPNTKQRMELVEAAIDPLRVYDAALSDEEWQVLKSICGLPSNDEDEATDPGDPAVTKAEAASN